MIFCAGSLLSQPVSEILAGIGAAGPSQSTNGSLNQPWSPLTSVAGPESPETPLESYSYAASTSVRNPRETTWRRLKQAYIPDLLRLRAQHGDMTLAERARLLEDAARLKQSTGGRAIKQERTDRSSEVSDKAMETALLGGRPQTAAVQGKRESRNLLRPWSSAAVQNAVQPVRLAPYALLFPTCEIERLFVSCT
eukprot:scaffold3319_cov258-Pinguiococcus_pyrenoidosus.AAC.7